MKKCKLTKKDNNDSQNGVTTLFTIINNDQNPLIKQIEITYFPPDQYTLLITIPNETPEQRVLFRKRIPIDHKVQHIGFEAVSKVDLSIIHQFIEIIQEIDPVPLDILRKLDGSGIPYVDKYLVAPILAKAKEGRHSEAIQQALKGGQKEQVDLANFYNERGDTAHWLQLLSSVLPPMIKPTRSSTAYFKQVNRELFRYYHEFRTLIKMH